MSEFIKVIIKHGDKDVEEEIAMPEGLTIVEQEKLFKQLVADFNAEEVRRHKEYPNYPMDKKRTFVKIIGPVGKYYCDFEKISVVSRTFY